ncbi:hypothetical protein F5887DRAFT_1229406 [Amanita rubescens]|nr:hypothetical protein F5887DRAFT_1229406 [Amanita rubescens]
MPQERIRAFIDAAHKHDIIERVSLDHGLGCYVSTRGFYPTRTLEKYLQACKDFGFDVIELHPEDWASLIELTASHGLKPKPEVGIQWGAGGDASVEELEAAGTRDSKWLIDRANVLLQAGAHRVKALPSWRTDVMSAITTSLPKDKVMWATCFANVFSYHIQNQAATANLFIDHSQGIWGTGKRL